MKLATCLLFALPVFGQTVVKPAQVGLKPAGQLSFAVVEPNGKLNTAAIGNGLTITRTADGGYFLSCIYSKDGLPNRVTVKPVGQVVTMDGMPRLVDIYRNGVLMSPDDGDYTLQQVDGKTTITFSASQQIDPTDVIRAVYWK